MEELILKLTIDQLSIVIGLITGLTILNTLVTYKNGYSLRLYLPLIIGSSAVYYFVNKLDDYNYDLVMSAFLLIFVVYLLNTFPNSENKELSTLPQHNIKKFFTISEDKETAIVRVLRAAEEFNLLELEDMVDEIKKDFPLVGFENIDILQKNVSNYKKAFILEFKVLIEDVPSNYIELATNGDEELTKIISS